VHFPEALLGFVELTHEADSTLDTLPVTAAKHLPHVFPSCDRNRPELEQSKHREGLVGSDLELAGHTHP